VEYIIDSHTHLADKVFDKDREEVIKKAVEHGVKKIVVVGETVEDAEKILKLAQLHTEILPAIGLYPTYLDFEATENMLSLIDLNHENLAAIGEVGLDYWKVQDPDDREIQREIFIKFINAGKKYNLPLNIHSRSAGKNVLEILISENAGRVQMHALDAKVSTALMGVEAGYYFSIPSSIVYSKQKQKLVKRLPIENLLLETDSPVLAPEKGMRNEPINVTLVVKMISEIKDIPEDKIRRITTENFQQLYDLVLL